jgi:hypothetical protein
MYWIDLAENRYGLPAVVNMVMIFQAVKYREFHECLINHQLLENGILRKIFGPTKESNGLWRIKTNEELDELIQQKNIKRFIKSQQL